MTSRTILLAASAFAAIAVGASSLAQTPSAAAPAAASAVGGLPPGPGHDLTVRVCSACHSPQIAAQQRLSRKGWEEVVDLMASRGATASDPEFAQITDYLSKNFPAGAAAAPPPKAAAPAKPE